MLLKPVERVQAPLESAVSTTLTDYFRNLNGTAPQDLYDIILMQVEPPLLKAALAYTRGNQSKAAEMLGLNRATLRKKLTRYRIAAKSTSALGAGRANRARATA